MLGDEEIHAIRRSFHTSDDRSESSAYDKNPRNFRTVRYFLATLNAQLVVGDDGVRIVPCLYFYYTRSCNFDAIAL